MTKGGGKGFDKILKTYHPALNSLGKVARRRHPIIIIIIIIIINLFTVGLLVANNS